MGKRTEKILTNDVILNDMVNRLISAFDPEKIFLFGSRARSEARPDSDYDLMIIVPSSSLPSYKRNQLAFRALCGIPAAKGVVVLTRQEFETKKTVVCSLPATVAREGKLLYEA